MSGAVHLTVDLDRCIGIGQCEMLEPEVFRLDDEDGISRVADGATLDRARAAEVVGGHRVDRHDGRLAYRPGGPPDTHRN